MGINITRDAYRMHTKSFMRVFFLFSCVSHLRWTKFRGWKRKKEIRTERERKKERWCERENKIRAVCRRVAGFECRMWTEWSRADGQIRAFSIPNGSNERFRTKVFIGTYARTCSCCWCGLSQSVNCPFCSALWTTQQPTQLIDKIANKIESGWCSMSNF